MTLRKWEWLSFLIAVAGIALALFGVVALLSRLGDADTTWLTWLTALSAVGGGALFALNGVIHIPLKVRIDDAGISTRRGIARTRTVAWSELDNLWVAKQGSLVALISTSAPKAPTDPRDAWYATRLHVRTGAVIGAIRPDALEQAQAGVRRHGRRELPVIYQH